jgi:hypothetical protein
MAVSASDYWRTCFVVMPYGVRMANGEKIDFDAIYSNILKQAVQRVRVKGSVRLAAHRADEGAQSRLLHDAMFHDLLGSRLALVDITGKNENVMLELGIRYAMLKTGTVVVRLKGTAVPFNLADVSIPEYRHRPPKEAKGAIDRIATSLRETLSRNEVDSPAYAAARAFLDRMGRPGQPTEFGRTVIEAEESALKGDPRRAAALYTRAATLAPELPLTHDRRGVLLRLAGEPVEAMAALRLATMLRLPTRASALEELFGSKHDDTIARMVARPKKLAIGADVQSLLDAIDTGVDEIDVRIQERKRGDGSDVFVASPTGVYWMGAVPQVLTQFGKVSDRGAKEFADKGYVISRYTVATPKSSNRTTTTADLATGLDKLKVLGSNVNVKIGGGGFRGGGGGDFGGGGTGGGFLL